MFESDVEPNRCDVFNRFKITPKHALSLCCGSSLSFFLVFLVLNQNFLTDSFLIGNLFSKPFES